MPDQPEFRENRPPAKRPTLADQHWRALLPQKKREDAEKDMEEAIRQGDAWRFSMLSQLSVNWAQNEGLLRQTIEAGRLDMFEALTAKSPDWHHNANLSNLAGVAAEKGDLGFVKLFVETYKVDIHFYSDEMLRNAAGKGHEDVVGYLLSKGADSTAWNGDPLRNAADQGHLGVVKKLVEAGADLKAGDPLEHAVRGGHVAVVEYLLSKGADARGSRDEAFIAGCRNGQTAVVALLLAHGVPADAQDNDGFTAACDGKFLDTARLLLDHGADVNAQGGRALRLAAYRGDVDTVRFLLDNNADPNRQRNYETPLTEAVHSGKKEIVDLLVAKGADPGLMKFEAWRIARREHKRTLQHALIDGVRKRRAAEQERHLGEFHALFPGAYSLDDLRVPKTPDGDSGLLLAARSGKFAELVRAAKGGALPRLEPDDLFNPDGRLDSVMGVLHRNKQLQQFFDPALWVDRTEAVGKAYGNLPPAMQSRVSFDSLTAQINQRLIMKKAKEFGNGLKPPKPGIPK